MKALLLALIASASSAHAQAVKPPAKSNVVVVQTADSAAAALDKLAQAFVAQGYTVDKLDARFLTLTLAPKTLPTAFAPVLLARATASRGANSKIQLAGEYRATVMGRLINGPAEMQGSEKGVPMSGFRALEKVALSYPRGRVSYARE